MAGTIREFRYATPGRGRGVLGMVNFEPCRKPGRCPETSVSSEASESEQPEQQKSQGEKKYLLRCYRVYVVETLSESPCRCRPDSCIAGQSGHISV